MLIYKIMKKENISINHLDTYIRDQHTRRMKYVKYHDDGTLKSKELYETDVDFKDEWDTSKRQGICKYLKNSEGTVIFVFDGDDVIGFCNIEHKLYGDYIIMPYIHVSKPYRHKGIAKKMFQMICIEAKKQGAKKLYISAHPDIDTYKFYDSVGCTLTKNIIQEMFDKEPADLQLEKDLSSYSSLSSR